MSAFWVKWLKFWGGFTAVFGVLFAVIDLPVLGLPARLFNDLIFLRLFQGTRPTLTPDLVASNGILGAVMCGFGLFLCKSVETLAKHDVAAMRHAMLVAFLSWYALDQWVSFRAGAYGNMVTNTVFFAAFLLPFVADSRRTKQV